MLWAEVGKVSSKSKGNEALSDEVLNDVFPQKVMAMKHLTLRKNL
jgi:hypothetical protein